MDNVASFAEAWIEILHNAKLSVCSVSPPSRRRGLKYAIISKATIDLIVASFAEAWIEITHCRHRS